VTATSFSGDGSNLTGLQAGYFVKTDVGIHTLSNIGIGTTNPTNAALHVAGRNLSLGGPGYNSSGESNLYLGDYNAPANNTYDPNIRVGTRDEFQFEIESDYGNGTRSNNTFFASPTAVGLNVYGDSNSPGTIFYYNYSRTATDQYLYFSANSKYLWFDGDTGRLGVNRSTANGWSATLDVNGTARVTGTSQFDSAVTVNSGNLNLLNGNFYATGGGGSNQVALTASDGSIEITRGSGGAYIDFKNSTSEDYDARLQESSGSITLNGNTIWHAGNDGSGSGLDADTVDGIQASSFLRSDASDTMTGELNVTHNGGATGSSAPTYSQANIEVQTSSNHAPAIGFHRGGYSATTLYEYDGQLYANAWVSRAQTGLLLSTGNIGSYAISNASTQTSNVYIRNTSPTLYLRDTNHNSAMVHNNSDLLYILRGADDSTTWTQVNSQWPFIFYLTNNNAKCGGSFEAVGNVTAYSSDRRLKENFNYIKSPLEKVLNLNGYTFDWKDEVKELGFYPSTEKNDVGLIAQEVQEVIPQAVAPAPFDQEWDKEAEKNISKSGEDYLTVQYEKLVPLLVEAIKEQQSQINILKDEIKILKQESN